MPTLEVIKFRDLVPVNAVTKIVSRNPLSIEIRGDDFSSVEEVLVNDTSVTEFIVTNRTTMLVTLPPNIEKITNISVRSSNFTRTTDASLIDYKIGDSTRTVSGILRLTQLFISILLKSPNSDIFNPRDGGGLQDLVGSVGSTNNANPIIAAFNQSVSRTADQIRRDQLGKSRIPLAERLLSAAVIDVSARRGGDELVGKIRVASYAGEDALAALDI